MDDLTRKGILRDIEKLKKTDAPRAFALRGVMEAGVTNENEARRNFESAMHLDPQDAWIKLDFSTALFRLGFFDEARKLALTVYEKTQEDLAVLDHLIDCTVAAARGLEAEKLLERRKGLKPKNDHRFSGWIQIMATFFARNALQDDEISELLVLTLKVPHDAGFYNGPGVFGVQRDEDSEWLSGDFGLELPVEKILEINVRLADVLAVSEIPPTLLEKVNFMFFPTKK